MVIKNFKEFICLNIFNFKWVEIFLIPKINFFLIKKVFKPKIKRVSLKDLIFVMEQEREFSRSALLYKALNK